jgi:ketosteroid isomerase-like protein
MQYEPTLSRAELIDLALIKYFGNVDAKNLDAVLDCFQDEALMCVQTEFTRHAGKDAIRRMFTGFMGAYETIVHKDFTVTVDEVNGRIAASFEAVLTAADGTSVSFFNTNFWRIRDGKFQEVYVYFSGENVLV